MGYLWSSYCKFANDNLFSYFCQIESLPGSRIWKNAKPGTVSLLSKKRRNCILSFSRRTSRDTSNATTVGTPIATINATAPCIWCGRSMSSNGLSYHQVKTFLFFAILIYILFPYSYLVLKILVVIITDNGISISISSFHISSVQTIRKNNNW